MASKPDGEISLRKRILFSAFTAAMVYLAVDCLMALPLLLHDGFHFATNAPRALKDGEFPANFAPNPRYIFSYLPFTSYTMTSALEGRSWNVSINAEGFRDEAPEARADAQLKFIALGDSFTFGWLVEQDERWDERLADLIQRQMGFKAASVNRGMWMSTFDQHALVLEDNFRDDASLVIHLVYPSHLQTINRHQDVIEDGKIVEVTDPILSVRNQRLCMGSADAALEKRLYFPFLVCLAEYRIRRYMFVRSVSRQQWPGADLAEKDIYRAAGQQNCERGYALMEAAIRQIAAFTRERHIPYLVVAVPRSFQLSAGWARETPVAEILDTALPQQKLRAICERTGSAMFLDLLPAMRQDSAERLYYRQDPHWRPAGHERAAQLIMEFLNEHHLLQSLHPPV